MFHPLPVFVGLRYVRTRRQGFFVSFISWVSMARRLPRRRRADHDHLGDERLRGRTAQPAGLAHRARHRLGPARAACATGSRSPQRARPCPGVGGRRTVRRRAGDARALRHAAARAAARHRPGGRSQRVRRSSSTCCRAGSPTSRPARARMIIGRVLAWQLGAEVGDEITVMVPGRDLLAARRPARCCRPSPSPASSRSGCRITTRRWRSCRWTTPRTSPATRRGARRACGSASTT